MPRRLPIASALCLACAAACADPGYYVVTPYSNEGLVSVDFRYWTVKPRDGIETVWPELGLAYGVTSRWTTELFMSWIGSSNSATRPSTLNWQNDFLLTQGEWPFDLALHAQLIRSETTANTRALEFGPVLQTDFGRTQANFNLFFDRDYGRNAARPTRLKYQWQLRHRWVPQLHLGVQGFGEVGPWDDWAPANQQSHRAGPALFSTLRLGGQDVVKLQAAYLLGKTYGSSGHMFTLDARYEF